MQLLDQIRTRPQVAFCDTVSLCVVEILGFADCFLIVVPTSIIGLAHDVTVFSADKTFVDNKSHRLRSADTVCLILYCAFSWRGISKMTVMGCHLLESTFTHSCLVIHLMHSTLRLPPYRY